MFFFSLLTLIATISLSLLTKAASIDEANDLLCKGDFKEARTVLQNILSEEPRNNRAADLLAMYTPEDYLRTRNTILKKIENGEKPKTELESLHFAEILFASQSDDYQNAKDYLRVAGRDSHIKSHMHSLFASFFELSSNPGAADQNLIKAFEACECFNPQLLLSFAFVDSNYAKRTGAVQALRRRLKNVQESDLKTINFGKTLADFIEKKVGKDKLVESFKPLYEDCPTSKNSTLTMATLLRMQDQNEEALRLLLKVEKDFVDLAPYYLLQVAQLSLTLDRIDQAKRYLDKFYKADDRMKLLKVDEKEANHLYEKLYGKSRELSFNFVPALVLSMIVLMVLVAILGRNKDKKKGQNEPAANSNPTDDPL